MARVYLLCYLCFVTFLSGFMLTGLSNVSLDEHGRMGLVFFFASSALGLVALSWL